MFLFSITMFLLAEISTTSFLRILAQYDNEKNGKTQWFSSDKIYWMALGIIQAFYLVFLFMKYLLLNLLVLRSNKAIHQNMIESLIRSPSSFFDVTPSGRLVNNFSNDLGIMDNLLPFVLVESIEGPIIASAMALNVFQINVWFIPLGMIIIYFLIRFYSYCKDVIVNTKQLDLRSKTPVFRMMGETISGLVQIRILGQRQRLLGEFSERVNKNFQANICFWVLSRAFGAYVNFFAVVMMIFAMILGIAFVTP